jgi:hypothetical protein
MATPKTIKTPAARPFKPKPQPAAAAKLTFARPVSPEKSGTPAGRGPDKPSRAFKPAVAEAVEGKGGVTAAVSVGASVVIAPKADPKPGQRRTLRKAEPPPPAPVAAGMVTAAVAPERQASVRVSVLAVPLREDDPTTPDYVPPSFRWPPPPPKLIKEPPPPPPPGEAGLRALIAAGLPKITEKA